MAILSPTGSRQLTRSPTSGWGRFLQRSYEERQRKPDDLEAQEGLRPIAIHALENLAHSDTGIVMLRRLLRDQLQRIEQGLDPINVVRDPAANKRIPTGAWNTILSPAETRARNSGVDGGCEEIGGVVCGMRPDGLIFGHPPQSIFRISRDCSNSVLWRVHLGFEL
jgi:hypothetical protein